MADVGHSHPHGSGAVAERIFGRGAARLVADGGAGGDEAGRRDERESDRGDDAAESDDDAPRMRDVNHTPPFDAPDTNRVYMRGGEGEASEEAEE